MTDSSNTTAVPTFQVAIDCADPHLLARFWAEALAYTVEDHHDQVLKMIELGFASREDAVEMDGRLSWPTAAACADPHGVRPRLLFQHVPEAKTVKNRLHLDLRFGAEAHDREVARFEALGARRLWDGQQGPHHWTTMADPEGNEFCVA
jgi:hypothetical protein